MLYKRPQKNECADFYHKYIDELSDYNILKVLAEQKHEVLKLFSAIDDRQGLYRYADGKWSIKEVFGHMIDTERVFAYRAMCFARSEKAPLPSMDKNHYVANANFDKRTLQNFQDEYENLRNATIALLAGLDEKSILKRGIASNVEFTVNAYPYIIAGHEKHHLGVLRERYLPNLKTKQV